MRIGIDASRAFVDRPTGTERYAFEVITRMMRLEEARKHEWILYTRKVSKSESDRVTELKNTCHSATFVTLRLPFLWTQVGLAYRTWVDRLDVLWVPAHTLPVLRKPGIKTVVTIHGIEYEWLPAYENQLQRWYLPLSTKYAVLAAKKLIAVSKFTKRQLIERLGGNERKITVIHEGFNPEILNSNIEVPNKFKILNKYQLKPKKYLLFVGTVQPRKNLVRLVEAFSRLTKASGKYHPPFNSLPLNLRGRGREGDFKLVIAGKLGWNYQEVLEAPKRFGVADKVVFTGYCSDVERDILLKNALVYVQPSITEGFGLPVLEAMAAGVPVVSSWGGALNEILNITPSGSSLKSKIRFASSAVRGESATQAGILFDPKDVNDMIRALRQMISLHTTRLKYVKLGKRRVKDFSWDKAAEKTLNILMTNL